MISTLKHKSAHLAFRLFVTTSAIAFTCSLATANPFAWFENNFVDPKDQNLDFSKWMDRGGFFPVPLIITEPAVGNGIGAAGIFIHGGDEEKDIPPNVTGVAAAVTGNDSWLYAAFHQGTYFNDKLKYTGAVGEAAINLDFFGGATGGQSNFNFEGLFSLQNARYRIGNTKFFAGGRWQYLDSTVKFQDSGTPDPEFDLPGEQIRSSGLGATLYYDSRDNIFTPEDGVSARILLSFDNPAWGSDFTYTRLGMSAFGYREVLENLHLSAKGELTNVYGDVPFFAEPFIGLRGIPAVRYQGRSVVSTEVELRKQLTERWSVLAFTGLGVAGEDGMEDWKFDNVKGVVGGGFRYLAARDLNLHVGLDVAQGPEQTVFYLQFGHAWQRD